MSKAISAGLKTMLLANQQVLAANLYTITLASGSVLYYTDAPVGITYGGHPYLAALLDSAPGFRCGATKTACGTADSGCEVDLVYDAGTTLTGLSLTPGAFAAAGGFDGATVQVDRWLTQAWTDISNGVVNRWVGEVSDCQVDAGMVRLTCSSRTRRLNSTFPRNVVTPHCNHALFDFGCTLNPASFSENLTVGASGNTTTNVTSNSAQATGYYSLGYIKFTSGVNNGLIRVVKFFTSASGTFQVLYPLPVAPNPGDLFTAYAGCDKTENTCNVKFLNLAHFNGFPFAPTPETMLAGTNGSAPADGSAGAGVSGTARGPGGTTQLT